jgi:hypothetical protein
MKVTIAAAALAILCSFATFTLWAQAPGTPGNPGTASLIPPPDAPPIKPAATGPYAVTIESNPTLPTHTIYRPADLTPFNGAKRLPIIAWGNGACSNAGLLFQGFLSNIASHGFMIIVSGPKDAPLPSFAGGAQAAASSSGAPPSPPAPPAPGSLPFPMTKDADMQTALDWAIKQASSPDSAYHDKLNPEKIAVMGQSCGGLQAIANSADPRVKTSIIWNSGLFPDGSIGRSLSSATKATLSKIHAPIAYINGGPADAAYVNALDDIQHIERVAVFFGWINVGHGGTYRHPGGGRFAEVGVAWLNWRLNGDKQAAKMFQGPDCTLCKDPVWHVQKKNMS